MVDVAVVGGGLAGLIHSILMVRKGFSVVLIEKNQYPFQRVCGEYISKEVVPFLQREGLYPYHLEPADIIKFKLSSTEGKSHEVRLPLGGFGVSRQAFDAWLAQKARLEGVELRERTTVTSVRYLEDFMELSFSGEATLQARVVIGAHGKRARLDQSLQRTFMQKRSPFMGIKYHVRTDQVDPHTVELHNFHDGYCGASRVEDDQYNLCYLTTRSNLKSVGSIEEMEVDILGKNPLLDRLLKSSDRIAGPVVINEFTFQSKEPVHEHVLMIGDAAGLITPLCGNGMAMAIHSAFLLAGFTEKFLLKEDYQRVQMERDYARSWKQTFAGRHWAGRQIQRLFFGTPGASRLALGMSKITPLATWLIQCTHGKPF